MNPRRMPLLLLLTLLPLGMARPLDSAWRLVETTDDLTAATDRRLILRADDWTATAPDRATSATLVVACGDRIPNAGGKSLLFFAGQPLEPFGNELAYAELRFDDQPRPIQAYLTIFAYGGGRQVAFLGSDQSRYFSRPLFDRLTSAGTLSVTYRAFSETRHVTFHLGGLSDALAQLPACHWTG